MAPQLAVPRGGWIRAIRDALGMSARDLAHRLGVTESTVARMETSERAQSIQLATLQKAAVALGCDLVYALVPRRPLEQTVHGQARRRAQAAIATVTHSMLLEDQTPPDSAVDALVDEQASAWVDRPGLWNG
jgi:predicted DNA-binding mobile mystery protein A